MINTIGAMWICVNKIATIVLPNHYYTTKLKYGKIKIWLQYNKICIFKM